MKVRITKAPEKMTYGGQKKHSLDIVRTTIDDYKPDYNDIESRYHRSADPRDESTVEVEGGEIIAEKGPANETRTFKAVGPNHSPNPNKEGGVPMNLKEGSFVYSKRKQGEMGVKGSLLKQFGKSENDKKTYSFAELADQYKVNTFYDILQSDKTDYLQKATAAAMVQKYEDKLADLALLQESRKGFPQGIPQIAEEKFQKMMAYMQQAQEQNEMQPQNQMMQQQEQSPEMMPPPEMMQQPMAMYGYNMGGGFVPDYSSVGDMYKYQGGGSTQSQNDQIMQVIAIYSQLTQKPQEEIIQALQSLPEAQQQEALQQMYGVVQQAMSEQQGGQEAPQQMTDNSGYYSAPGGEPQYDMQQEAPAEEQQMRKGGSYSGTYYQGTYFQDGGAFVPSYGDSSYNDQFGGEMIYDYDNYMLPKAQKGRQVSKKDFENLVKTGGYTLIPGTRYAKKGNKIVEEIGTYKPGTQGYTKKGTSGKTREVREAVSGGKAGKPWENFIKSELQKGTTFEELAKKGHGIASKLKELYGSYYKPIEESTPDEVIPGTDEMCVDENGKELKGVKFNKATGKCEREKDVEDIITYEEQEDIKPIPGEGKTFGDFGGGYYGMPWQNTLGLMAAAAYPPLYIRPFYDEPQGVIPRPTFYDPERELASAQESARALEQMAGMVNPQAAGAMANYIQANAAKSSADTIGRYQNLNVGVANQFSPLQAQIFNSLAAQKREAKDKRYMGEAIAAQQYTDAMRKYATNVARTLGEGVDAGVKLGQLYDTSAYYTADPFGRLRLKPGVNAADAIMAGTMGGYNRSGATGSSSDLLKRAKELKQQGYSDPVINRVLNMEFPNSYNKKSSSTNDDDLTYGFGASAYPFSV